MASLGLPEVYRVGGSVRNELLGVKAKDADYIVRKFSACARLGRTELVIAGAKVSFHWKLSAPTPRSGGGRRLLWASLRLCCPRAEVSTATRRHDVDIYIDKGS